MLSRVVRVSAVIPRIMVDVAVPRVEAVIPCPNASVVGKLCGLRITPHGACCASVATVGSAPRHANTTSVENLPRLSGRNARDGHGGGDGLPLLAMRLDHDHRAAEQITVADTLPDRRRTSAPRHRRGRVVCGAGAHRANRRVCARIQRFQAQGIDESFVAPHRLSERERACLLPRRSRSTNSGRPDDDYTRAARLTSKCNAIFGFDGLHRDFAKRARSRWFGLRQGAHCAYAQRDWPLDE